MRIPDRLLKCVGFVSRYEPDDEGGSRLRFGGTAFIVGVLMDGNIGLAHIVTARHVAEAIEPGEAVITMNAKDGMSLSLRAGSQKWFYHPTEKDSVDVAVLPFGSARFNEYDIEWIPEQLFATDQRIADFEIGLGDELFIIGLFTRFFGRTTLTPIVRTGNIAMMPKDKLPAKGFGEMEAYLVEGRSIGGLSGSPAFVRNTVKTPMQTAGGKLTAMSGLGGSHLLGLVHGHWDVPPTFSNMEQAEAVNMGVSIIVPAKKILETLYNPELDALRKKHWENNQPSPDSGFQTFERLQSRLSGVPPNSMIDMQQFENIKEKHGGYASWAVWADASGKPKSNMDVLSVFEDARVLSLLRNDVVMVGLNFSVSKDAPRDFFNFHGKGGGAFKIRYAFKDSPYYGAYMTDIIKEHMKAHPDVVARNVDKFREELRDLRATAPTILAFGNNTYKLLRENLDKSEYRKLIKLTHYSHRIGKEDYKEAVFKEIESQ
jgi:hypothetical protein